MAVIFQNGLKLRCFRWEKLPENLWSALLVAVKKNDMDRACLDQMIQECNFRRKNQGSLLDFLTNLY